MSVLTQVFLIVVAGGFAVTGLVTWLDKGLPDMDWPLGVVEEAIASSHPECSGEFDRHARMPDGWIDFQGRREPVYVVTRAADGLEVSRG